MIPDAGLVFSVAGLSASFAGLAGLVMALRRGGEVRAIDTFRLRQMVEFSFANILLAVSVVPLASLLGSETDATRIVAAAVGFYVLAVNVVLTRRTRRVGLEWQGSWRISAIALSLAGMIVAVAVVATGNIGVFEALLVLLLARPMLPFLLVLASWQHDASQTKLD